LYDDKVELEVLDDPRYWGKDLQTNFTDTYAKNYQISLKKYIKIIKKTYDWVRDSEMGRGMVSIVAVRSSIGMSRFIWVTSIENSEEFAYYASMITDIIAARLAELGTYDGKAQIFKIFSIKNILPEDYSDKKEVNLTGRIDVIEIGGGTKAEIAAEISKSKKRLKK
jgi:hypothetical protein